ncbi:MAG TPA: DegT/DnrJ/EryC1/StrS family aminotransferase [Polyangiales bacterium]|jgi:dTDP-4-amino-4,6-dideoxygalactose transaminase|nr:DegT/DnrJ/EryC1/StrS family aminotransferase [Polyangiales bacterium]
MTTKPPRRTSKAPKPEPIPTLDLAAQHAPITRQLTAAFTRVLASNAFILGKEVSAFEEEIASYLGVEHAIGVSSGTDAILLALMSLGVGPSDEVIVPAFSFFATAGCVARVGAKPVFVDIEPDTFNLSIAAVADKISAATKAIIPVHLFGQTCDLENLCELASARGIAVIEDAAQAIGAQSERMRAGAAGRFGCFSFFPSKNLGALGDAGLVTCHDPALAKRARLLRAHGAEPKYHHAAIGGNFRLDALQAAFLRAKLSHLQRWTKARQTHAAQYDRLFATADLSPELLTPPIRRGAVHVYNQYVVRSSRRDSLLAHLRGQNIGCEIYYPVPLHRQACFAYLGESLGEHPEAERASREVLALPLYPELTPAQIERVARTVVEFLRRAA